MSTTLSPEETNAMAKGQPGSRIEGFDLARAVAIFGMIVCHFVVAMCAHSEPSLWLASIANLSDGRPAALFVILAGVGISLRTRLARESQDRKEQLHEARTLTKRGLLLLMLGFANLVGWIGDILRVYGVTLLLAARLLNVSNRKLLWIALSFVLGFVSLLVLVDYEKNWTWSTMEYHGLWTIEGLFRNLFYDGFRSVFPWSGFVFFGMWLGRLDLRNSQTNWNCIVIGTAAMLIVETFSAVCLGILLSDPALESKQRELYSATLGTVSMPPLPLFMASAGGFAVSTIAIAIRIADRWPQSFPVKSLVMTGQMALTWYLGHIYLGLGTVVVLGAIGNQSHIMALLSAIACFAIAMTLSRVWLHRHKLGPLEWCLRRLSE